MVVSWLMWDGRVMSNKPVVRNLEEGCMVVCVDRELVEKKNVKGREAEIAVELKVGGRRWSWFY